MNIIKHKKIFVLISCVLVVLAFLSMIIFGFKLGIDFKGGSALEVSWANNLPTNDVLSNDLKLVDGLGEVLVQPYGANGYLLRTRDITPIEKDALVNKLSADFPGMTLTSFTSIGPSVGRELARKALVAIILVSLGIIFYIAFSFRGVSRPVQSWKYGVIAIVTLLHDVAVPTGVFVILAHIYNVEVDTLFVVALLTILGLSVSDTIVVFDRIRENLKNNQSAGAFPEVVGRSLLQVISRSIATSGAVILALLALAIFGPKSTQLFAIMLTAGMFFGTYSSIFLASPLLVMWNEYTQKKKIK